MNEQAMAALHEILDAADHGVLDDGYYESAHMPTLCQHLREEEVIVDFGKYPYASLSFLELHEAFVRAGLGDRVFYKCNDSYDIERWLHIRAQQLKCIGMQPQDAAAVMANELYERMGFTLHRLVEVSPEDWSSSVALFIGGELVEVSSRVVSS